jgi:hypothetical protein
MSKYHPILSKKSFLVGAAGLIVIVAILELTNTTHLFHKQSVPPVIPAHTSSGKPISTSSSQPNTPAASTPQDNTPLPADVTNHTLIAPTGTFVSNHFPGQNGSSTTEASVCNTSPGATCYIKFTNVVTGDTTQLAAQVTDARGTTSWYWDVSQDAHLSAGQWKVMAVATLGSQTKTATDTLNLTVK